MVRAILENLIRIICIKNMFHIQQNGARITYLLETLGSWKNATNILNSDFYVIGLSVIFALPLLPTLPFLAGLVPNLGLRSFVYFGQMLLEYDFIFI